jgi:antitoxin Phd
VNISIDNLVSISEANQNFSKVARLVDEKGTAVILKNNAPRYVLLDFGMLRQNTVADDMDVDSVAARILTKHIKAFEELAK